MGGLTRTDGMDVSSVAFGGEAGWGGEAGQLTGTVKEVFCGIDIWVQYLARSLFRESKKLIFR